MNPTGCDVDVTRVKPAPLRSIAGQRDRIFYGSVAIALALTVFVGFGPTYYFRMIAGSPPYTLTGGPVTPLVHVHAALFSLWVLLFIAQTTLVAQRRIAVHRRLAESIPISS